MTHNRENLRLSLHDLQQTTTAPINTSSSTSSVSQSMSVIANQAITTVANKFNKGGGGAYQNDKCERLKKMTSITCSDSEDDSERRIQLDVGGGGGGTNKWHVGGYEGVSFCSYSK